MKQAILNTNLFWTQQPAFLYSTAFLLGCLFVLQSAWAAIPLLLLLHPRRVLKVICLFLCPLLIFSHLYIFPPAGTEIEGYFSIHSIQESKKFSAGWIYKGVLKTKQGKLPCTVFSKNFFTPKKIYQINGRVQTRDRIHYTLKIQKPWEATSSRWSLAELRLHAKQKVRLYIQKRYPHSRACDFLTGIITGQLDNRVMRQEFTKLGLSHIMAISGFHFALLTLSIHHLLRLFLPHKIKTVLLMLLLTLYFLFVGDSPSVLRAWSVAMIYFSGQLFEMRSNLLNSLGLAMLVCLIYNPLYACSLSFQLSFLATAGILLLFRPCQALFMLWLPRHPLNQLIDQPFIWQLGYVILSYVRNSLALTLSVHLAVLPLLLSTFQLFCFNSLLYNLFFPFLVSLAMVVFLVGLVAGGFVHLLNSYYCEWVLYILEKPPIKLKTLYVGEMPDWVLMGSVLVIVSGACLLEIKKQTERLRIVNFSALYHL